MSRLLPSTSLRIWLAGIFASFVVLVAALSILVMGERTGDALRRSIGASLASTAAHMADTLDRHMHSRSAEIVLLSGLAPVRLSTDFAAAREQIERLRSRVPAFSWIGRTDAAGTVVAATDGILEGKSIGQRPVFLEALDGIFIGDVHEAVLLAKLLPNPTGEPIKFVDVSVPLQDDEGRFQGVLAAHLSWVWAREAAREVLVPHGDESRVEAFVVSASDDTILLGPEDEIGRRHAGAGLAVARANGSAWGIETWPDGGRYLTGYALGDGHADYPGLGWTVVVRQPMAVAEQPVRETQRTIALLGAVLAVIFAAIGWAVAGMVARPLRAIADTADRLRNGETAEIQAHRGLREVETLSSALRDLLASLNQMEELAHQDRLTGLANRIGLNAHLDLAGARATRDGKVVAVLCIDLDGFKPVNDRYGHFAGDAVLRDVGRRLRQCVRGGDIATRLGGDEFALVLLLSPDAWRDVAGVVARRVVDSIARPVDTGEQTVAIGCSVGIACWRPDGTATFADTIRMADEAMYAAKRAGKGRVAFHGDPGTA
ncbi:MAG: diguanylate cyclase [Pseudomonadota bacterium]|nr:diguanylate cyclase [Pseudomonadota bacterium]